MSRTPYRFYFPGHLNAGESIALPEGESHHLSRVLRLRPGARVTVFDSRGNASLAEVVSAEGNQARVQLIEALEKTAPEGAGHESPSRLHVAVSFLKHRAMDWMIEKLCELDVATLQPLICNRTVVIPSQAHGIETPERWQKIALTAAKQSGRNVPMEFYPATPLAGWLERERPPVLNCFAHKSDDASELGEWLSGRAGMSLPVQVAVGPEGGWTPEEVEMFLKEGFQPVSLGPLVLRAETAAITVAAACRVML